MLRTSHSTTRKVLVVWFISRIVYFPFPPLLRTPNRGLDTRSPSQPRLSRRVDCLRSSLELSLLCSISCTNSLSSAQVEPTARGFQPQHTASLRGSGTATSTTRLSRSLSQASPIDCYHPSGFIPSVYGPRPRDSTRCTTHSDFISDLTRDCGNLSERRNSFRAATRTRCWIRTSIPSDRI